MEINMAEKGETAKGQNMISRAYSVLMVKSIDEEERVIEGIATTPTPDRMEDVVDPLGVKFALPMPLLWQHLSDKPVGNVEFAKPTKKGIPFKARIPQILEPGVLKDRVDEAWQSVKAGLVRAVSIGFRGLEVEEIKDSWGLLYKKWEWLELSLVTIPANSEATITAIKSFDAAHLPVEEKGAPDAAVIDAPESKKEKGHIVHLNSCVEESPFVINGIIR